MTLLSGTEMTIDELYELAASMCDKDVTFSLHTPQHLNGMIQEKVFLFFRCGSLWTLASTNKEGELLYRGTQYDMWRLPLHKDLNSTVDEIFEKGSIISHEEDRRAYEAFKIKEVTDRLRRFLPLKINYETPYTLKWGVIYEDEDGYFSSRDWNYVLGTSARRKIFDSEDHFFETPPSWYSHSLQRLYDPEKLGKYLKKIRIDMTSDFASTDYECVVTELVRLNTLKEQSRHLEDWFYSRHHVSSSVRKYLKDHPNCPWIQNISRPFTDVFNPENLVLRTKISSTQPSEYTGVFYTVLTPGNVLTSGCGWENKIQHLNYRDLKGRYLIKDFKNGLLG